MSATHRKEVIKAGEGAPGPAAAHTDASRQHGRRHAQGTDHVHCRSVSGLCETRNDEVRKSWRLEPGSKRAVSEPLLFRLRGPLAAGRRSPPGARNVRMRHLPREVGPTYSRPARRNPSMY